MNTKMTLENPTNLHCGCAMSCSDLNWHFDYCNLHKLAADMRNLLLDAIEDAGFKIAGPTDFRAAEDGEPKWVCRARELISKSNTAREEGK